MTAVLSRSKRIFFSLAAFCLAVLFIEIISRFALPAVEPRPAPPVGWAVIPERRWIEYHPQLGWFHEKNKIARLIKGTYDVPLTTNSLGLRGQREYLLEKPEATTRVYVMGDSFVFGFGVKDEDVLTAKMEKEMPSLEAMNLGVAGYGLDQIALLLENFGFQYHPDVVFIAIYPEDFWRSLRRYTDAGYGKPYFSLNANEKLQLHNVPVPQQGTFQGSQFPEVIAAGKLEKILRLSAFYRLLSKVITKVSKQAGLQDPDSSEEWILGRAILQKMISEIRREGTQPVIVFVPPVRWITGTIEPVRDSMIRFARRENIDFIDLTPDFQEALKKAPAEKWFIKDDNHWTPEGHEIAAQELLSYLKKRKIKTG